MTWDQIEGRYKQYYGCLIERWGKLVRDDAAIIHGKREQLFGIIQERYRISKEEAETQVNEFSLSLWSACCEQESNVSPGNREQARGTGRH
jgi:uncharacterized protein YjbJ (UPF0337 family)